MTPSDLEGHSSLLKCAFCYSCVAVDKISTDIERRAVPLRQLSPLQVINEETDQRHLGNTVLSKQAFKNCHKIQSQFGIVV